MNAAIRSVFLVNRHRLTGTAVTLTLAAILLTATGIFADAGIQNPDLALLASVAGSFAGTVLMITVFIVASIFSNAVQQRRREFALLRAIGATARQIRGTVTAEALVVVLVVIPVGAVLGAVVAPLLIPLLHSAGVVPLHFTVPFSPIAILGAAVVLVPTVLIAARVAARAVLRVSPTVAVRESTVEPPALSRARLLTAAVLAGLGVAAAVTPFLAPGTVGSATGATSGILLIVAAGLAGPALVHWIAVRLSGRGSTGVATVLALGNARGFSRRLSSVIIPLALLVAFGNVQSGVNIAAQRATAAEITAGVHADLVVLPTRGMTPADTSAIGKRPGVDAVAATGHVMGAVRVDDPDGDVPALDDLDWDTISITTMDSGAAETDTIVDPGVIAGSLRELGTPGTIAVSADALLFTGKGVGDTVDVRLGRAEAVPTRIVAVYQRGLGFGDYLMGADQAPGGSLDAVFVTAEGGSAGVLRQQLTSGGLPVISGSAYAGAATESTGGQQQLSLVLLLALLGFVAAAAANTLAAATRGRRDEFTLLQRIGATRSQVMQMAAVETGLIAVLALGIGMLAVLPALLGVGWGLLGVPYPILDLSVAALLAGTVVLIATLTVLPTAWRVSRIR